MPHTPVDTVIKWDRESSYLPKSFNLQKREGIKVVILVLFVECYTHSDSGGTKGLCGREKREIEE